MMNITWSFSEKLLDRVDARTQEEKRTKQEYLKREFIGKELKKFYSPKRKMNVYRIGHTNRIISENEFALFINSGLIVPNVPQQVEKQPDKKATKKVTDTADIPIVEPNYTQTIDDAIEKANTSIENAKKDLTNTNSIIAATKNSLKRHAKVPSLSIRGKKEPIQEPAEQHTVATVEEAPQAKFSMAEEQLDDATIDSKADEQEQRQESYNEILEKTGVLTPIEESTFFDVSDIPEFQSFKEDHNEKQGFLSALKGKMQQLIVQRTP